MSAETLRIARESYEAWNRSDLEGLLAVTAEDFEFQSHGSILLLPFRDGLTSRTEAYGSWLEGLRAAGLERIPD